MLKMFGKSARVNDSSERSSQPEDSPLMAMSWILPEVTTSTGVDTRAMPTTDLETGTDTDGNSRAVVSVTGDNSDGPTSTGVGADGTTRPQVRVRVYNRASFRTSFQVMLQ